MLAALVIAASMSVPSPVRADSSFVPDSTADEVDEIPGDGVCATTSGACTLRAAIQETNALAGADTITLPAGTYTLTLGGRGEDGAVTGDLDIVDDLTITRLLEARVVVDGNNLDRVFHVLGATTHVEINAVTITGGHAGGGDGGGIWSEGVLDLVASTVTANSAGGHGGGIHFANATLSPGTPRLLNSTVSGNAASTGGGVFVADGTVTAQLTTVADNLALAGGGVGTASDAVLHVDQALIAGNTASTGPDCDGSVSFAGGQGSLIGDAADCDLRWADADDVIGIDPLLGPLEDNGGPTHTHELLDGSPAIDSGRIGPPGLGWPIFTDQRGVERPQGAGHDLGSFETGPDVVRLFGADRVETAARISQSLYPSKEPGGPGNPMTVVTGLDFPDALAAGPFSVKTGLDPILLVTTNTVPSAVWTEWFRLYGGGVIVGGPGAVSENIEVGLSLDFPVVRLAGPDRYATAAVLSASAFDPGTPVAYIATGLDFPDALAGSPVAGINGGPMLLVRPTSIPAATADELGRLQPQEIVILGGTGVVSLLVEGQLAAYTSGPVTRLAGADRYETAAVIAASQFAPGVPVAYIATGLDFPDAVAAGPVATRRGGPILLVRTDEIPASTAVELERLQPQQIVILGGPAVVSTNVRDALFQYVK